MSNMFRPANWLFVQLIVMILQPQKTGRLSCYLMHGPHYCYTV